MPEKILLLMIAFELQQGLSSLIKIFLMIPTN